MTRPSPQHKEAVNMNGLIDTRAINTIHRESSYAECQVEMSDAQLSFRVMRDPAAEFYTHIEQPAYFAVLGSEDALDNTHGSVTPLSGQFRKVGSSGSRRSRLKLETTLQMLIFGSSSSSISLLEVQSRNNRSEH